MVLKLFGFKTLFIFSESKRQTAQWCNWWNALVPMHKASGASTQSPLIGRSFMNSEVALFLPRYLLLNFSLSLFKINQF